MMVLPFRRFSNGVAARIASAKPKGEMYQRMSGHDPGAIGRAALHDRLIRNHLGKALGLAAIGQPGENLLHDGQVVASGEEIIGEEIDRLAHCGCGRRAAAPGCNLLTLGQRDVEDVDGNSANRFDGLFGAAALQTRTGLGQQGLRLVEIARHIQKQAGGRAIARRLRWQRSAKEASPVDRPCKSSKWIPSRSASVDHFARNCSRRSSSNGFMAGSVMSLPSWVLFHCSVKRTELVAVMKPTVVSGSNVSIAGTAETAGTAADSPWGTVKP